jgi:iron complex outermembrane receptor protein
MNRLKHMLSATALLILMANPPVFAEELVGNTRGAITLDTVVVSAAKTSETEGEVEKQAIRSHKVTDLAEILSNEMVEVQMIRKGAYGNEVSIRGFGQENLLVTVEDTKLEGACGSRKDPPLSHINMLMVDRLEVRQGPFDVTRAGALGGSINVVGRQPSEEFGGEALVKAGSFGLRSGGGQVTGGNGQVQALAGYVYSESDSYEDGDGNPLWQVREGAAAPYNEKGKAAAAFRKHDAWGKLRFTPGGRHTVLLSHTYGKAEDIMTPRVVFDTEEEETNLSRISWEMENLGDFSKSLAVSFFRNEVAHYPHQAFRAVSAPKNNKVESLITGGSIQNVAGSGATVLTYGVDGYHRDWWGDVYNTLTGEKINGHLIPSVQSRNVGAYVQVEKRSGRWSLTAGLRYDRFRQEADEELVFSRAVTEENRQTDDLAGGHLSVVYYASDSVSLFGGAGRSHRTPTGAERYVQGNPAYFGNPELKPVENTEIDLGLRMETGRWMLQVKGFYSDLGDYIYQEYTSAGYKSYTNIDAHILGADVTGEAKLMESITLKVGLACQRGRKDSLPENNEDRDLGQMAPLKGRLALRYDRENPFNLGDADLFANVEWSFSDSAEHIDEDAGEVRLGAWNVFNVRTGCRFERYTLNLGVENLFDEPYTVANSYEWDVISGSGSNPAIVNEPGRSAYASLRIGW